MLIKLFGWIAVNCRYILTDLVIKKKLICLLNAFAPSPTPIQTVKYVINTGLLIKTLITSQ